MTRSFEKAIFLCVLFGAALRLYPFFLPLEMVDRLFVPDDTYYTLAVARSLAAGLGPSVDGVHLTSGFQPLLAFLLTPVFALGAGQDGGLRATLLIGALADLTAVVGFGLLARRLWDGRAGVFAAALWALSPFALSNALGGLETSLALALGLFCVLAFFRADGGRRAQATAGVLCGLALLARVDSALLVFLLGALTLLSPRRRALFVIVPAAAFVVAPWWLYCLATFGTVVPESGPAVRELTGLHHDFELGQQLAFAAGTVLTAPMLVARGVVRGLFENPVWGAALFALVLGILLAAFVVLLRRTREPAAPALFGHAALTLLFYASYLPALWFFRRYLQPVEAALLLLWALLLSRAFDWPGRARAAFRVGAAGVLCLSLVASLDLLASRPAKSLDFWLHGAQGYREVAKRALASLPDGAVVGSFQSGALAYYAPPGITVVNLDGVVDGEAAAAFRTRRIGAFLAARKVTHLADWTGNLAFLPVLDEGGDTASRLHLVADAPSRGFPVYELR